MHVIWLEPGHKAKTSRKSAQQLATTDIFPDLIQKGIPLVKNPARNIAKTHDIIRRKIAGWAQYHL